MSMKLRKENEENGISLILECGVVTYSTHDLDPRECIVVSVKEIIEKIDNLGQHAKYKLWISHVTEEANFLSIPYNWSAGCRWITNEYIRVEEDNCWFMDGGLVVITNSKAGLRRWKQAREMLCNTFNLNDDDVVGDDLTYPCKCGKVYLSRQGLWKHCTKAGNYDVHAPAFAYRSR